MRAAAAAKRLLTTLGLAAFLAAAPAAAAPFVEPEAWDAWRASFLDASGRVVDTGNNGISHSEGQSYGLLLAVLAEDRETFERIWSFTRTELLLRDDGLAAWRWSPSEEPRVTDMNDAADGDILIAYALGRAGKAWDRPDLTQAGAAMAEAIGSHLLFTQEGRTLLRPAAAGYDRGDRPDGPVVNLSYWVFEAFPVLAELAPGHDWAGAEAGGRALLASVLAEGSLPPEWLSVARRPRPAEGFPAEFGYNALRVPLYLLRAAPGDEAERARLAALAAAMTDPDTGAVRLVDLASGATKERLTDPGYRILPAAVACAESGTPLPDDLKRYASTLYYPSTLHLLTLAHLKEEHPRCLR
ncbi:glycosyl hydrolase family 8 [Antarcticirhabdus aurantiaca]|uniref:Glycosyl hydrolase family 8 n=1 Tax=Antarcticirhabdus aurantiaca TaxID=2606717 RepID=A0ACD4NPL0_9HYPH|nr:glycosyl hydrolase family 8 [Antarcticirhabdus aurantiaca]WAJ28797.1 glycosyl hydrolase family 8 [Jeongeuplla avenae]